MPNIVVLGDNTQHNSPIVHEPNNTKINYNGLLFMTVGSSGNSHSSTHSPGSAVNVIVNPTQTKITFKGIPFAIYGAQCGCGDVVKGSLLNPKIIIEN